MKKLLLVALMCLVPSLASAGERVMFDFDKAELSDAEKAKISVTATQVKMTGAKVIIIGNTDKVGTRLYNLDLGMRRAKAVVDALLAEGVPEDQLSISLSYGEEKPFAPKDGLIEHRKANRRVDLVLVEAKVMTVSKPVYVPTYKKNRISVLGGAGPVGLSKATLGVSSFKVSREYEPVIGLSYARMLNRHISLGVSAFSNNSYFINLGLDF